MKKVIQSLGVLGVVTALSLAACGESSPNNSGPTGGGGGGGGITSGGAGTTGDGTENSGRRLFESNRTSAELAQDRANFLANTLIQMHSPDHYTLNSQYVVYRDQALSPAVFGYVTHTDNVKFTAAFPAAFRENLPQAIKDAVSNHNIDELDIFFTPQQYDGRGFKPHCWAAGNSIRAVPFAGEIYSNTLLMGIYHSDFNIDRDIRSNQLTSFGVSIHDNTLSPVQPELNIQPATMYNFSFWSLVIDQRGRRAAATLHWNLRSELNDYIANGIALNLAGGFNLQQLMERLNRDHRFNGSPIMQKLDNLVR